MTGICGHYGIIREECQQCELLEFCRESAASDRSLQRGQSIINGVPEWIPMQPEQPEKAGRKNYSAEEVTALLHFFLYLAPENLPVIQLRIIRPDLSISEISKSTGMPRKKIYEFLKMTTREYPEVARILYKRRKK